MGKSGKPKPGLLPSKLVSQHAKSCRLKNCGLCYFAKNRARWQQALKSKWLHVCLQGKVARVGCSACRLADVDSLWANFEQKPLKVRLHHLKRHESSKIHVQAVETGGHLEASALAPPLPEFEESLRRMRSAGSSRDGGTCSDRKHQVRWCLAEATMEKGRQVLRDALAICLTRDERKGRLLVRWRACQPDLSSASGVCGFQAVEGFADDLANSVKSAVQVFCTPRTCLPRGFQDKNPSGFDTPAEKNIRDKTIVLVTDAAAPELLGSSLLTGRRPYAVSGRCEKYLTGVQVIGRDAPHATTRLLKRPFQAIAEVQSLMDEYVSGQDAFAQKIFHSPLYTQWWKEIVGEETGGPTSMSAAKHRFGSSLVPLSRMVDNMPAMIRLCHKIALIRGSSGAWASKLLLHFSGKKAVLLGMLADAAASVNDLTRSLDDEDSDVSKLPMRVQEFALSVQAMFSSEKVLDLPTYTKTVCDCLRASPVRILHHGQARAVGITDQDKAWAMALMKVGRVFFIFYFGNTE